LISTKMSFQNKKTLFVRQNTSFQKFKNLTKQSRRRRVDILCPMQGNSVVSERSYNYNTDNGKEWCSTLVLPRTENEIYFEEEIMDKRWHVFKSEIDSQIILAEYRKLASLPEVSHIENYYECNPLEDEGDFFPERFGELIDFRFVQVETVMCYIETHMEELKETYSWSQLQKMMEYFDDCIEPDAGTSDIVLMSELHRRFEPILIGGGKTVKRRRAGKRPPALRIIRSPMAYAPISMTVLLTYVDDITLRNNIGNNFIYWRMRLNCPFDPDPLLLTGAVSGFLEWSNIYRRYIVLNTEVISTVVNNEAFPVAFNAAYSDFDQTASIVSRTSSLNLGETLQVREKLMSPSGGMDRVQYRKRFNLATLTGNKRAYIDSLTYSALVNANPAVDKQLYWNMAASADSNFVKGVTQMTQYRMKIRFTERQSLYQ